jgi:hypothetical protein
MRVNRGETTGKAGVAKGFGPWRSLAAGFNVPLEPKEGRGGGRFLAAHPALIDLAEGDSVEMVPDLPPLLSRKDQAGTLEHAEVLHDGKPREAGDRRGELTGRCGAATEKVDQSATGGVGQRSPYAFESASMHM